jgi:ribosomal protein S18 acetylase RimI-like enzyme
MSDRTPIPLKPALTELDAPEFKTICEWTFADTYVGRLLRADIPQRIQFSSGKLWVYKDPNSQLVGFGTIDVCDEYGDYTNDQRHPYIPLIAVNPEFEGRGHGNSIVRHLIGEGAFIVRSHPGCHDTLFLDVYEDNARAIRLYERCGFERLTVELDPREDNKPYIVMAKRLSIARA